MHPCPQLRHCHLMASCSNQRESRSTSWPVCTWFESDQSRHRTVQHPRTGPPPIGPTSLSRRRRRRGRFVRVLNLTRVAIEQCSTLERDRPRLAKLLCRGDGEVWPIGGGPV